MNLLPPFTGDQELDAWNQEVARYLETQPSQPVYNQGTGIITDPVDEAIVGYMERYLHVRFADDRIGTNFSDSPTNRLFYGVHNDATDVESLNHVDYTWFEVEGGFGPSNVMFYKNLGGRATEFFIGTVAPSYRWSPLGADAIDLDDLIGTGVVGEDELADGAVTTPKLADNSVTKVKMADAAIGIDELETTGTPAADTFLSGTMQWLRVQSGMFLPQYILLTNVYATADEAGYHIYHPVTHDYARVFSIPNPAVTDFEIGTCFVIINLKNTVTVRTDYGTIQLIGAGTEDTAYEIAVFGKATLTKVEADRWVIDGTNITSVVDPGPSIGEGDFNFLDVAEGEGVDFNFLG
jgi:hypothetical protein